MESAARDRTSPSLVGKQGLISLLAALGVMTIHAETRAQFGFATTDWCGVFESELIGACEWAVPFFFLVAAYRFFLGFRWNALLPKWKRRVCSLLVPYLLWSALYLALLTLLPRVPFLARYINASPAPMTAWDAVLGVLTHRYAGHLWFLQDLLLFSLLAPLFYALFSRAYLSEAVLAVAFSLLLIQPDLPACLSFLSWRMLFFYAAGAYLALRLPDLPRIRPKHSVRVALLLLVPVCVVCNALFDSELYSVILLPLLWFGFDETRIRPRYAYSTTFFLYVSHILLLSILKKIALRVLPHTQLSAVLTLCLLPLVALPLLVGLARAGERLLPRTMSLLTGGRSKRKPIANASN